MLPIYQIHKFEQIKLLADPRRLAILRLLMAGPATLTQLGETFGEHPAWIRHHIKQLESAGLVEICEIKVTAGVVEKFYKACAAGLQIQQLILPNNPAHPAFVFSGSHDLALEQLAKTLSPHLALLMLPVGSLDGLVSLRQGLSHFSGSHLLDPSGEYNLPFVRHFFPDRQMNVVTLAHREQGLILAPDNPKSIRSLADIARDDVTFINRNAGSGTRIWFDQQLHLLGIPPEAVKGYHNAVRTHTESATAVALGHADVALGLQAAACQHGLDFIPLFHERYDMVIPHEHVDELGPLLDTLQTAKFRHSIEKLSGYETKQTGNQLAL